MSIKSPLSPSRIPINVAVLTLMFNTIHRFYWPYSWLSAWALTALMYLVVLCLVEYYYHLKDHLRELYQLLQFTQFKRRRYLSFKERVKSGRVWHFEAEAHSFVEDDQEG